MTAWIAEQVGQIMAALGYLGIAFLMFMENLFPPIPSELIMPAAGFTAATEPEKLQLLPSIAAGVIGTVVGAFPWYYLGKVLGEDKIKGWLGRHGKWIGISVDELDKTQRWFARHGTKAVFWGRMVPVIRTLVSLPAGFSEMSMGKFLLYSTLGITCWVSLLTFAGYWLGRLGLDYHLVDQYLSPVSKVIAALLVVAFTVWVIRHWQKRGKVR